MPPSVVFPVCIEALLLRGGFARHTPNVPAFLEIAYGRIPAPTRSGDASLPEPLCPLSSQCRLLNDVRNSPMARQEPWVLPLRLGLLCYTASGGNAENGEVADGGNEADGEDAEEEPEEEEGLGGLGMGMGDREPASVAVTESADGFLVVAVVSLELLV